MKKFVPFAETNEMEQTLSHLQELLANDRWYVSFLEILGLVRVDLDEFADFARNSRHVPEFRELSAEECQRIVRDYASELHSTLEPADFLSFPLEKEYIHVTLVRTARKRVLSEFRPRLLEALKKDELIAKLRGNDPVKTLQEWVNDELVSGSKGRQKDLKRVLLSLKYEHKAIYMGILKIASVLGRDPADYSEAVVAAFCNPSMIPQKGLGFAVTLLARAGGSRCPVVYPFEHNLKLFLSEDCSREDLSTGRSTYGRLSETKTVLKALQLAHVEKGRHFAKPDFPPAVKDFLRTIL